MTSSNKRDLGAFEQKVRGLRMHNKLANNIFDIDNREPTFYERPFSVGGSAIRLFGDRGLEERFSSVFDTNWSIARWSEEYQLNPVSDDDVNKCEKIIYSEKNESDKEKLIYNEQIHYNPEPYEFRLKTLVDAKATEDEAAEHFNANRQGYLAMALAEAFARHIEINFSGNFAENVKPSDQ